MRPCVPSKILKVLYRSLCVLMDSNGSVWVFTRRYLSLKILMGPIGS